MKNKNFKNYLFVIAVLMAACTKLDPKPYSGLTTTEFYKNPTIIENAQSLVAPKLVGFGNGEQTRISNCAGGEQLNLFDQQSNNSDYMKQAYLHNFNATIDGVRFNLMWNTFFSGVREANLILSELATIKSKPANIRKVIADLKVIRAFFMYNAMENFGNVPIDTLFGADPKTIKTEPRAKVFAFVEKELKENVSFLDTRTEPKNRVNKYVGFTLLAQLYLNAQVYSGTARWLDASIACDSVLAGPYSLTTNYFDNFAAENAKDENILLSLRENLPQKGNTTIAENVGEATFTPNALTKAIGAVGNAWSAFSSPAEMYTIYEDADRRKRMWLIGDQYYLESTNTKKYIDFDFTYGPTPKPIRLGSNSRSPIMSYKADVQQWGQDKSEGAPNIVLQRNNGIRNVKYYPTIGSNVGNNDSGNDYVIMRLADIILMKAEAQLRLGNTGIAATYLNKIRMRAFKDASFNILTPTLQDIRDERTRELMLEGYSRRDNIRFEIADPSTPYWSKARKPLKPNADANPLGGGRYNNQIYPIPPQQIQLNPNIRQNPGY